ncbi:transmembrane protein 230 isoform X3 [Protopterus annectens]|uniref:transmembrane protein 230 isoform X3 n=1 Tax=Protopterus annectens TaxID=7888 RepID=UPI001CFA7B4C|nr:transmembrane protein 230 isoform X3 [Protopterus annectens]
MMPSRNNAAAGIPSSKVKYSKLSDTDEGYIDLQFKKSPPKIPYKAIALAAALFLIGTVLLIIGALLLAGRFDSQVEPFIMSQKLMTASRKTAGVILVSKIKAK